MTRIHLDHAATTPLAPEVLEEMLPYLTVTQGNPSSVHESGRAARAAVDSARDRIAAVLDCAQREIVFTGSGTEATTWRCAAFSSAGVPSAAVTSW